MSTVRDAAFLVVLATVVSCSSTTDSTTAPTELSPNPQTWAISDTTQVSLPLGAGHQATRTLKVGSVLRTYYVAPASNHTAPLTLVYSESVDGRNFSLSTITNLRSTIVPGTESEPFFDNPDVIRRADGKYVMIYDFVIDTVLRPTPRRMAAFVSTDGITWGDSVMLPETAMDESPTTHKALQSRASMIVLPDGSIRAYYTTGGGAVGSARSTDGGVTWTEDAGYRLSAPANSTLTDPSAIIDTDGSILLYAQYIPDGSCIGGSGTTVGCSTIRMARSSDGLNFTLYSGDVLHPSPAALNVVQFAQPDVFVGIDGTWRMHFGHLVNGGGGILMGVRQP